MSLVAFHDICLETEQGYSQQKKIKT